MSVVDFRNCIQYIILGTNRHGEKFPKIEGFATDMASVAERVKEYRAHYAPVDHVNVDMAFPYHL